VLVVVVVVVEEEEEVEEEVVVVIGEQEMSFGILGHCPGQLRDHQLHFLLRIFSYSGPGAWMYHQRSQHEV